MVALPHVNPRAPTLLLSLVRANELRNLHVNNRLLNPSLLACAVAWLSTNPALAATTNLDALAASATLETLVVTANRQPVPLREVAASISVLNAEEIAQRGQSSVSDVLRSQPGINVSGNGGIGKTTGLRIRGEESYRTLVLIDGMNISDTSAPQVSPRFEDLLSGGIERIEVLRGPQGMMYGADAGGIVSITTRRAHEPFAADAAVEYGSYDSRNLFANIRGKSDRADYSLSATHFDTDGFNSRTVDASQSDDDGYLNTTAHFNGGLQISDELRAEVTARNVRAENEYDGCFDMTTFSSTNRCHNDYDLSAYRASLTYDTEALLQKIALQRSESRREDFANGNAGGPNDGTIDELQYQGIFRFDQLGDFVYGADLKEETLAAYSEAEVERDQLGYYLEWQGKVANSFYYTAGARHDDNDDFGDHTSYRVSMAYVFDYQGGDALKLKTSYGTGFRAPSLYELAYNAGPFAWGPATTTDLTEEGSKGFDAGVEYHWHAGGSAEIVFFDQSITDEIRFDLINFYGYLQESGVTHSRGVELSGMYPLTKEFRLLGNYTYNDTEDPDDNQRVRRPRHVANIGFDYSPIATVTVFTNLRMVRGNEDQIFGVGRVELDNYSALEASVNWAVNSQFDVYVRGENLLRDDYQEVVTYNIPKEAVYAGVRFHFR